MAVAPPRVTAWFDRTSAGAEIDLVLALPDGVTRWAVEIRRSLAPNTLRGFRIACDDIGATRRIIVTPGDSDGVGFVPPAHAQRDPSKSVGLRRGEEIKTNPSGATEYWKPPREREVKGMWFPAELADILEQKTEEDRLHDQPAGGHQSAGAQADT